MDRKDVIGIVGAGTMGRGILQLFAQAGFAVRVFDVRPDGAAEARDFALGMVDRQVIKGTLTPAARDAFAKRVTPVDSLTEFSGVTVVVEAVAEDLAVKRALFRDIESVLSETALLTSNTSSLAISAIAAGCRMPGRVAGMHFFNPVPLMKIVEIVPGIRTDAAVISSLVALVQATGHRAVVAADQPGFLVNHAGRALYTEGLRLLEECVADVATVDRVMRESCGFRMGPFELLDLTGLDVSSKVMQSIYEQFLQDPRYRPSSLVPPRVAAGLFGRKTGQGFYIYADGAKEEPEEPVAPTAKAGRLWLEDADRHSPMAEALAACGAELVERTGIADAILIRPWGEDVSASVARRGLDSRRTLALDPAIGWDRRQVLMISPATTAEAQSLVHGWLAAAGRKVTVIADSPGFIVQRVLAMIVNTGCEIAQRGISEPKDIDDAVRLGLGYPKGPLAMGDDMGSKRVLSILEAIQALTGDPRYRPSAWLRRRSALGLSLATSAGDA